MSDQQKSDQPEFTRRNAKRQQPEHVPSGVQKLIAWVIACIFGWFVFMVIFVATYKIAVDTGIAAAVSGLFHG